MFEDATDRVVISNGAIRNGNKISAHMMSAKNVQTVPMRMRYVAERVWLPID
jgi:hypothetical protein